MLVPVPLLLPPSSTQHSPPLSYMIIHRDGSLCVREREREKLLVSLVGKELTHFYMLYTSPIKVHKVLRLQESTSPIHYIRFITILCVYQKLSPLLEGTKYCSLAFFTLSLGSTRGS